jgi:hypothetical protein
MAKFVLTHRHSPQECAVAYAAWRGFQSPLRHLTTPATCALPEGGRHLIWWTVEAADERAALAQLPPYLVERTEVRRVSEVAIP